MLQENRNSLTPHSIQTVTTNNFNLLFSFPAWYMFFYNAMFLPPNNTEIEDLRKEENSEGYAKRLAHGEIGKGLNDYDAIFSELKRVGFNNWISIEDGVDGMEQLQRSVAFLRRKIAEHWKD